MDLPTTTPLLLILLTLLQTPFILSQQSPPTPTKPTITQYLALSLAYTQPPIPYPTTTIPATPVYYTQTVVPFANYPIPSGLSTTTDTTSYPQITLIQILLPPGSAPEIGYNADSNSKDLYVPMTYSPSPTCSSQSWRHETNLYVSIPRGVREVLTAFSTSTAWSEGTHDSIPWTSSREFMILQPTDIPSSMLASVSDASKPVGLRSNCYTPTTSCWSWTRTATAAPEAMTTEVRSSCYPTFAWDRKSGAPEIRYRSETEGLLVAILTLILVPSCWVTFFLFAGFVESYVRFRRLMRGGRGRRGSPWFWVIGTLGMAACCLGPVWRAREAVGEKAVLEERWRKMSGWERWKLWWRVGWGWGYPEILQRDGLGEPEVEGTGCCGRGRK